MLVLAIGDPHFKDNNALETEEMEEKIFSFLSSHKVDLIVCLGDILDRFEKISLFALRRAILFLEKLSIQAKTFLLIGNHDRPNNSTYLTDEHPFLACKQWKNLVIVENIIEENGFIFVPYVPPGKFLETLDKIPVWREAKAIFAHQELSGAKMGAIVSQVEEWKEEYPLLISGHIHDYQEVSPNFIYVGTPIQHGYNDTVDKSLSLFSFGDKQSHKRVYLDCKKKQSLTIKAEELERFKPNKNVSLRLTITGSSEQLKVLRLHKKVKELRAQGIKVHFKPEEKEQLVYSKQKGYLATLRELIKEDPLQLALLDKLSK